MTINIKETLLKVKNMIKRIIKEEENEQEKKTKIQMTMPYIERKI